MGMPRLKASYYKIPILACRIIFLSKWIPMDVNDTTDKTNLQLFYYLVDYFSSLQLHFHLQVCSINVNWETWPIIKQQNQEGRRIMLETEEVGISVVENPCQQTQKPSFRLTLKYDEKKFTIQSPFSPVWFCFLIIRPLRKNNLLICVTASWLPLTRGTLDKC